MVGRRRSEWLNEGFRGVLEWDNWMMEFNRMTFWARKSK